LRDWRPWPIEDNFGNTLRELSTEIIRRVESGHFLDEAVDHVFSKESLKDPEKALIYEIVSGVVRWKGYLQWILSQYVQRHLNRDVQFLLWMSLYQIQFMRKSHYHVVNEAVGYVRKSRGQAVANFVNAVLRRFVREGSELTPPPAAKYSFPEWLMKRWSVRFGVSTMENLLKLLNETPEFAIRVHPNGPTPEEVREMLERDGVKTREGTLRGSSFYVNRLGPVLGHRLFREDLISVQDEGSQLAGRAVLDCAGRLILDACAGIGTKSRQIQEAGGETTLISMDREPVKLRMMRGGGIPVAGDGFMIPFREGAFDTILLDAPCSSLGIVRKHPEIKWRRKESDIAEFGRVQFGLLQSLWKNLKRGGNLVYSVCSFEPEETLEVIQAFGATEKFVLENPLPFLFNKDYFLALPQETGTDGFFIARLRKI
jgi:16S rRNA (cytosine967-C5)-methyltransferase